MLKAAVPLGLYFYLIRNLVVADYARLSECVALQTLIFIPAAYFFIITEDERQFFKSALHLRLNKKEQIGYVRGPLDDSLEA
jgi:hypothetical protein